MPSKGKPIDLKIKCPWCGAVYPDIKRNGQYTRDKWKIPQYYCKRCQKGFSVSVIKIKILVPPEEVELGNRVRIEVKAEAERGFGIKGIGYRILKGGQEIAAYSKLKKEKAGIYKAVWDIKNAEPGKYVIELLAIDSLGYASIQPKVVRVAQHYDALIKKIAAEYGIDQFLLKGLIWQESSFDPAALSSAKAEGLTQLTPITIKELKKNEYGSLLVKDPRDPEQNIRGGACYLAALIRRFGDVRLALGAYNWGPGNVIKKANKQENELPKTVRGYINRVLELAKKCETDYRKYYETKE